MPTRAARVLRAAVRRVDAFFFGADLAPWDAIRIGAALLVLGPLVLAGLSGNYERFYSTFGALSRWEAIDTVRWPAFIFLIRADPAWIWWVYGATFAAAGCLALGLWTRPAAAATLLLYCATIQRNLMTFNGETGILAFVLFALVFAPRVQPFSLDHRLRGLPLPARPEAWPARFVQFNVCAVYFFTTVAKLVGKWDVGPGELWYATTLTDWFRFPEVEWLRSRWFCALALNGSLLIEGGFAFLIWTRLRLPLLLLLIGLHLGIIVLFRPALLFFNLAAIVALCAFFQPGDLARLRSGEWFGRKARSEPLAADPPRHPELAKDL